MSCCQKCWSDSSGRAERYGVLVEQRDKDGETCTPQEQAGTEAFMCKSCLRKTAHEITGECMMCGFENK